MMVLNVVHFGRCRCGLLSIFGTHLHRHQNSRHFKANGIQQAFKQFKGFALVFLLRIFLRIAAQMNPLTQMVKRRQMFAPLCVKNLKHDTAFEWVKILGASKRYLGLVFRIGLLDDAFEHRIAG